MHQNGDSTVYYDDSDVEHIHLDNKTVIFDATAASLLTLNIVIHNVKEAEPYLLKRLLEYFCNKPFLNHKAQGFEQFGIVKVYETGRNHFSNQLK